MLDLSGMKRVQIDPESRTAVAQAGLLLGELDQETQAFGLATPLGVVSLTGIAGLTLGGGLGWLSGKYGLACDNVLAADLVTADGRLLTVSASEHEELYWGIRGGGGNFGVVTSFTYQLHPVGPVVGGGVAYPISKAAAVLRFYHEFSRTAPDEVSTTAGLGQGPDGSLVVGVGLCSCGLEEAEALFRSFATITPPLVYDVRSMPYVLRQRLLDAAWTTPQCHYWKSNYMKDMTDSAVEVMVRFVAETPHLLSAGFQQLHGAAARVLPTATAFPHRDDHYDFSVNAKWADPAASAANIERTRAFSEALQPFVERGVYVNALGEEGEDRVKAAYGPNYERLAALKRRYDPTNLFRMNQNITPAPA